MSDCPVPLEALPRPLLKHAGPAAPLPLRMMAAKGLVPAVAPIDLATLLFVLSFDPEEPVREAAARTAAGLPVKILGVALRSEAPGPVLDWLAAQLSGNEEALQLLLLNAATPDATVARLAGTVSQPLAEIVRQNELRLLRHDDIVRQLCRNPSALASTVDAACEFCVRNGLTLLDVPQLVEAHRRVHGVHPGGSPEAETAAKLLVEYQEELAREPAPDPVPERPADAVRKGTMTQRVLTMSVSEKIKLATLGNKEARTLLLRDANKLVALAAVTSPRITDGEVMTIASSRTVGADVLRHVYSSRERLEVKAIKLALVKNPKVPLPTALKLMQSLAEKDIKEIARDRNVPQTIQSQAKAWIAKKQAAAKGHEGKG